MPGVSDGEVRIQSAGVVFMEASVTGDICGRVGRLADGSLDLQGNVLSNVVPVPYAYRGAVRCELVFGNGDVLTIAGLGFDCSVKGSSAYVEQFVA